MAPAPAVQPAAEQSPSSPPAAAPTPTLIPHSERQHAPSEVEPVVISGKKVRDGADSILGEPNESEDEVFSSRVQQPMSTPLLPGSPSNPLPLQSLSSSEIPTLELQNPLPMFAPQRSSVILSSPAVLHPQAEGKSTTGPEPGDLFAFGPVSESSPRTDAPLPRETETPHAPEPIVIDRPRTTARSSWLTRFVMFILVPYAALMTVIAAYGLYFKPTHIIDPGHPLSAIPDTFGEFDPATRKKVKRINAPLDAELPAKQKARIGGTIDFGQLVIEPIGVEKRQLHIVRELKSGEKPIRTDSRNNALVLHLRIRNTSSLAIFPLDPAFTRFARPDDKPATCLVVDDEKLYGGAISWPFGENVKREYEEAQIKDYEPLMPGETREYVVFTNQDATLAQTIRQSTGPLLWRVQLRRGTVMFQGKEIAVTAVIGVQFTKDDVKNLN